jgi:hypothetical protein
MARMARVVAPGLPHHITQRGNRRQATFFGTSSSIPSGWASRGSHGSIPGAAPRPTLAGEDAALVTVAPLRAMVGAWMDVLATGTTEDDVTAFRRHERSGRPLGREEFVMPPFPTRHRTGPGKGRRSGSYSAQGPEQVEGLSRAAMTRIVPPHRGQGTGSTPYTFRISRARERRTSIGARSPRSGSGSCALEPTSPLTGWPPLWRAVLLHPLL